MRQNHNWAGKLFVDYAAQTVPVIDPETRKIRQVQILEHMRRLFALVLPAAQFVFYLMKQWPTKAVLWLRRLSGKLGLPTDRDGPYILLRGLSVVWHTVATLSWTAIQPFLHHCFRLLEFWVITTSRVY